jgi:hypothetical protein
MRDQSTSNREAELPAIPRIASGDWLGRVYVDAAVWKYGRMTMCHMIAENLDALHAMADKIGVARRWFQNKPGFPHYDICKAKRELAVRFGATEISWRELVAMVKRPNIRS